MLCDLLRFSFDKENAGDNIIVQWRIYLIVNLHPGQTIQHVIQKSLNVVVLFNHHAQPPNNMFIGVG